MEKVQTRKTIQRAVILEELRGMKTHPTAEELFEKVSRRLPRISLGTIYRNLNLLVEQGHVIKLDSGYAFYRFDGDVCPHRHVRCLVCGRIADVAAVDPDPDCSNVRVPGFSILKAQVIYDGMCDACAAKIRGAKQ